MGSPASLVPIWIDHGACTNCRMCYVACREIDLNAVVISPDPLHRLQIDTSRCLYPRCTVCLMYCPAPGSIREVAGGRSLVPPPPEVWTEDRRWARSAS
jgi:TPP-dependent indolepyruvate ferredoxin oxidoreductase alpha subunit